MSGEASQTPMSDHVAHFWRDLRDETVSVRVDMRRVIGHDAPDGPAVYWNVAVFSDGVAKALVAERDALRKALERAQVLVGLVTVRQAIHAGDEAIEAAGLNPYAMNEGQATGDEHASTWWLRAALSPEHQREEG
jgi:hypothetical protein